MLKEVGNEVGKLRFCSFGAGAGAATATAATRAMMERTCMVDMAWCGEAEERHCGVYCLGSALNANEMNGQCA